MQPHWGSQGAATSLPSPSSLVQPSQRAMSSAVQVGVGVVSSARDTHTLPLWAVIVAVPFRLLTQMSPRLK